MNILINPRPLNGTVQAIPSKSQAHRFLICAAFADKETELICPDTNQDIEATVSCLNAMGAQIHSTKNGYRVQPAMSIPKNAALYCGESGSTLRFLLPVAGALGIESTFHLEGRLGSRPLSPLWEQMETHGCYLSKPDLNTIQLSGKLTAGEYTIPGNISSQYITGLTLAAALIPGKTKITVTGKLESAPYVAMTQEAINLFGIPFHSPGQIRVEGDWSNAAFFLTANEIGSCINVEGLNLNSAQGDRAITHCLSQLKEYSVIDGSDIPDLIPILAIYAACNQGAKFENINRLRLKESDRVATVEQMLNRLGCVTESSENSLIVYPGPFHSCQIDAANDHRIAMAAAIAATKANGPVTILGAQCVAKSYPGFWDAYQQLGGNYEQHIR